MTIHTEVVYSAKTIRTAVGIKLAMTIRTEVGGNTACMYTYGYATKLAMTIRTEVVR